MEQRLFTFGDLTEHLMIRLGGGALDQDAHVYRAAAQEAMREFVGRHEWSYYYAILRIQANAPYSTGTVAYTHATRTLTLTDGTWPEWAALGVILIGTQAYEVESRDSGATLTLSPNSNPGQDVAAGTAYTLYRDSYPLPVDFVTFSGPIVDAQGWIRLAPTTPKNWLSHQRLLNGPGEPTIVAVVGSPNYIGGRSLRFSPPPSTAKNYEAVYRRRPRPLVTASETTGTVTIVADSLTVTGTGTAFKDLHVGCVFRPGTASETPTGLSGLNPAVEERIVTAVDTTAQTLTVDAAFSYDYSAVKYTLSDPVDAEEGYLNAIKSLAAARMAAIRSRETFPQVQKQATDDLELAMEGDDPYPLARRTGGALIPESALHLRYGRDG